MNLKSRIIPEELFGKSVYAHTWSETNIHFPFLHECGVDYCPHGGTIAFLFLADTKELFMAGTPGELKSVKFSSEMEKAWLIYQPALRFFLKIYYVRTAREVKWCCSHGPKSNVALPVWIQTNLWHVCWCIRSITIAIHIHTQTTSQSSKG